MKKQCLKIGKKTREPKGATAHQRQEEITNLVITGGVNSLGVGEATIKIINQGE